MTPHPAPERNEEGKEGEGTSESSGFLMEQKNDHPDLGANQWALHGVAQRLQCPWTSAPLLPLGCLGCVWPHLCRVTPEPSGRCQGDGPEPVCSQELQSPDLQGLELLSTGSGLRHSVVEVMHAHTCSLYICTYMWTYENIAQTCTYACDHLTSREAQTCQKPPPICPEPRLLMPIFAHAQCSGIFAG